MAPRQLAVGNILMAYGASPGAPAARDIVAVVRFLMNGALRRMLATEENDVVIGARGVRASTSNVMFVFSPSPIGQALAYV